MRIVILILLVLPVLLAADWPQWRGINRDGEWTETGIVDELPAEKLPRKWTVEVGSGYSGPTVAKGKVYVTDRLTKPREVERVLCFDEATGSKVWSHEYETSYGRIGYPAGPRACVTIDNGQAFALGSTGWLHVFDANDGTILWKRDLQEVYEIQMPIWGISAAPLVVGDLVVLHISGKGACVVALDRKTGEEKWHALDDRGQYSAPILVKQAGKDVVVCWTGDSVAGIEVGNGQVLWRYEWRPRNMPIGVASPVLHGDRIFCTSFYDGSLMLKLGQDSTTAEKVWQRVGGNEVSDTDALQSIISTPVFDGKHVYGVDSYGQLRCLDAKDGERVWEDLTATPKARWSTIHFVHNDGRYFLFNERGDLIIAKLSPKGYEELSRSHLLDPTTEQLRMRGGVCWSHPAFANKCVFARNDKELVCASLAK